jgi:CheY-like chemotaxis protein
LQEVERVIGEAEAEDEDAAGEWAPSTQGDAQPVSPAEPLAIFHEPVAPRATQPNAARAAAAMAAAAAAAPARTAEVPARPAPRVAPPPAPAPADQADEQPHILVVDDDGTTRAIARGVFETTGYRVSEARDGAEALVRLARGEHFSLMLLDLDMPNIGGRDVLRSVRQSMATVGLPVVVLTGAPDHATEVELMEMGADDYLRKPIDPPLLSIRIKAAMRRARG